MDAIVTEFAKDPHIAELHDLWYEQKESGIRFYQDEMPERVSLTDNPEFRTIKNMILQEAGKLTFADLPVLRRGRYSLCQSSRRRRKCTAFLFPGRRQDHP